ncbi:hypothetical protein JKP88DRAFT_134287, partial [Tribonema minus]
RWRLHVSVHAFSDLQAWYHGTFHEEVYRLRGPFFVRSAPLCAYRGSHRVREHAEERGTCEERTLLRKVLLGKDTRYSHVECARFLAHAVLSAEERHLFDVLVAEGVAVLICGAGGARVRRRFRLSFV